VDALARVKDWAALTPDEQKLFTRQMEVFAGYAEYTDIEIGRLVDAIREMRQLDNTLIFYIVGDNGASVFTGKIDKVTIELQEVKAADKNEAEKSHKEAVLKKGLSD
jgi:arylsulfatase A-like enzyme